MNTNEPIQIQVGEPQFPLFFTGEHPKDVKHIILKVPGALGIGKVFDTLLYPGSTVGQTLEQCNLTDSDIASPKGGTLMLDDDLYALVRDGDELNIQPRDIGAGDIF